MENIQYLINKYGNPTLSSTISINDLKEKELEGSELTDLELKAVFNYNKYCLEELNKNLSEEKFHSVYRSLGILANIGPYEDFLDDKYSR